MGKNSLVIDVAALKPLPGLKKNFKKSEKSACFTWETMVYYVYMIKKKTLQERIQIARKRMFLTLLDTFGIILTQIEKEKHYG